MSKLFAFQVSVLVECSAQDGQYNSAAQMWVGAGEVVAEWNLKYCEATRAECEQLRNIHKRLYPQRKWTQCEQQEKRSRLFAVWCFELAQSL